MTGSEVGLADVLAHQMSDEREHALRALLMRPLLPGGSEELVLVRRQSEFLRNWFARETGWRLHVERSFARLYKTPANTADSSRGLPDFDRDRTKVTEFEFSNGRTFTANPVTRFPQNIED